MVINCPLIIDGPFAPVANIGMALAGSLSHGSLYGDIFHVRSTADAINIAYTSVPLRPHQDLAYYESMPGLQLLHCVAMGSHIAGGESVLIDCLAAAEEFRRIAPHHFRALCCSPASFVKQREGASMMYQRAHIVLKEDSNMNDFDREIVAVNWSPPFEGPLCLPLHQSRSYFAAYAAFEQMLDNALTTPLLDDNQGSKELGRKLLDQCSQYAEEHTWEHRLGPGDMLVFNNRRMLHGRRGFSVQKGSLTTVSSNTADRHLVGAYTNIDDTLNQYRVLCRSRGNGSLCGSMLNSGHGTSSFP